MPMKKNPFTEFKKCIPKKPFLILLGIFLVFGTVAQFVVNGTTVPTHCQHINHSGFSQDVCKYLYKKETLNYDGISLNSTIIATQNGEKLFKLINHYGQVQEIEESSYGHVGSSSPHSHNSGEIYTSYGGGNHSHAVMTENPTSSQHATILASGFTTTPTTRGWHLMNAGTYAGKWIGIDMPNSSAPDYKIYKSKPKNIFIPNKGNSGIIGFLNQTVPAGQQKYNSNFTQSGATQYSSGIHAYNSSYPQNGGIEICEVDTPIANAPCTFTCGDSFIDTRNNQSYTTLEHNGKCWMGEDYEFWFNLFTLFDINNDGEIHYESGDSSADGSIIPPTLKNMCKSLFPAISSSSSITYVNYYNDGSNGAVSYAVDCSVGGSNYHNANVISQTLQPSENSSPTILGLYDYHEDEIDFLADHACPEGWRLPSDDELDASSNSLSLNEGGKFWTGGAKITYYDDPETYFAWGASYNGWNTNIGVYSNDPGQHKALAGRFRCVKGTQSPEWVTGSWSACSANNAYPSGIQYRTVNCEIAGNVIHDTSCTTTKPPMQNTPCALPVPAPTGTSSSSG